MVPTTLLRLLTIFIYKVVEIILAIIHGLSQPSSFQSIKYFVIAHIVEACDGFISEWFNEKST